MSNAETAAPEGHIDQRLIADLEAALGKRLENPDLPEMELITHEILGTVENQRQRIASLGLRTVTENGMRSVQAFFHTEGSQFYNHFPVSELSGWVTRATEQLQEAAIPLDRKRFESFLLHTLSPTAGMV